MGKESRVCGDDGEWAIVRQRKVVESHVRPIDQAEPNLRRGGMEHRIRAPIHVWGVPEEPKVWQVSLVKRAILVEAVILQNERNIVNTIVSGDVRHILVGDHETASEATVSVEPRRFVWMRVVPHRRCRLVDRELRRPGLPRLDRAVRATVHDRRELHPVDVHGGHLIQSVFKFQPDALTTAGNHRRAEMRTVETPRRCLLPWYNLRRPLLSSEVENAHPIDDL